MKCNICGQEFGNGINCQHCGADRVTAGANANGYTIPAPNNNQSALQQKQSKDDVLLPQQMGDTTICPFCGEIIPINANYCPYCSRKQKEECPKCKNIYSAKYPACPKCGTNRIQFYAEEERRKQEAALERKKEEEKRKQQQEALSRLHAEEEKRLLEMTRRQKESFLSNLELPSEIPHAVIDSPIEIKIEQGIGKVSFGMTGKEVTDNIGAPDWYNVQEYSTREYTMRYFTKTKEVFNANLNFFGDRLFSITIAGKSQLSTGLSIELFNTRMKWFDPKMLVSLLKQHAEELPYGFAVRNNKVYCGASYFDNQRIYLKQTSKEEKDRIIKDHLRNARVAYQSRRIEGSDWSQGFIMVSIAVLICLPAFIDSIFSTSYRKAFLMSLAIIVVLLLGLIIIIRIHNLKLRKKLFKEFNLEKYGFKINQILL